MNTLAQILPTLLVVFVVAFTSGIVQRLVRSMFGVENIANLGTQKIVRTALNSLVFAGMFAIGFALIGNPYTLGSFLAVWGIVAIFEWIVPSR